MAGDPPGAVDVLVLGGGGSGLAAAVSAAQNGARVVLAERTGALGGTTAKAVGSISAANSRMQRRARIVDDPATFRADMEKFIIPVLDRDDTELRDMLSHEAGRTVDWLEKVGVSFVGPFIEPPHTVRRLVNAFPTAEAYIYWLARTARRLGVDVRLNARVTGLTRDDSGGWTAEFAGPHAADVSAATVILAAGDMSGNPELRDKWLTPEAAAAIPINPQNTGDAQSIGEANGAAMRNMDVIFGPQLRFPSATSWLISILPPWKWFQRIGSLVFNAAPVWLIRPFVRPMMVTHMSPSKVLFEKGAILVNTDGRRFCDEKASVDSLSLQPGSCGYIVLDAATAKLFRTKGNYLSTAPGITYAYLEDYRKGRRDLFHESADPAALAALIGVDPVNFAEAVASAGTPSSGKLIALGPVYSMLTVTEGGVALDRSCRVLTEKGEPIPGLYAAGGSGGGVPLNGHGHHLAWAMTSGRIAGAGAAAEARAPRPARSAPKKVTKK